MKITKKKKKKLILDVEFTSATEKVQKKNCVCVLYYTCDINSPTSSDFENCKNKNK